MTYRDEIDITVEHTDGLALLNALIGMLDSPGEHPGMEAEQTFLLTAFQIYLFHHMLLVTSGIVTTTSKSIDDFRRCTS